MSKKIKNLEIKIAQNRGYTTELKKSIKALGSFSNEHAESIVENMDDIDKIKNAILDIGKEFINLIDDKISHNTAQLHETNAKNVIEKALEKLNSKTEKKEYFDPDMEQLKKNGHFFLKK